MIRVPRFGSPEEAQDAFYRAFEQADLEAMMAVWADDDEIVCIHPAGPRLTGPEQVRDAWREIFRNGPTLLFTLSEGLLHRGATLAVSCVQENIRTVGDENTAHVVAATNVFVLTVGGWRMLVHHATPSAPAPQPQRREQPNLLH